MYIFTYNYNHSLGQTETEADMLRSILAQLEFSYLVREFDKKGIPFRSHLHCPEVHSETGKVFCEREDAAHVLKVGLVRKFMHQ